MEREIESHINRRLSEMLGSNQKNNHEMKQFITSSVVTFQEVLFTTLSFNNQPFLLVANPVMSHNKETNQWEVEDFLVLDLPTTFDELRTDAH